MRTHMPSPGARTHSARGAAFHLVYLLRLCAGHFPGLIHPGPQGTGVPAAPWHGQDTAAIRCSKACRGFAEGRAARTHLPGASLLLHRRFLRGKAACGDRQWKRCAQSLSGRRSLGLLCRETRARGVGVWRLRGTGCVSAFPPLPHARRRFRAAGPGVLLKAEGDCAGHVEFLDDLKPVGSTICPPPRRWGCAGGGSRFTWGGATLGTETQPATRAHPAARSCRGSAPSAQRWGGAQLAEGTEHCPPEPPRCSRKRPGLQRVRGTEGRAAAEGPARRGLGQQGELEPVPRCLCLQPGGGVRGAREVPLASGASPPLAEGAEPRRVSACLCGRPVGRPAPPGVPAASGSGRARPCPAPC